MFSQKCFFFSNTVANERLQCVENTKTQMYDTERFEICVLIKKGDLR